MGSITCMTKKNKGLLGYRATLILSCMKWENVLQIWGAICKQDRSSWEVDWAFSTAQGVVISYRRVHIMYPTESLRKSRSWIQIQLLPPYIDLNPPISNPKPTNLHPLDLVFCSEGLLKMSHVFKMWVQKCCFS